VRYWDTSALVPLVVTEDETQRMRALLDEDHEIVTWALSSVEFASAIERRARQGALSTVERRHAHARLRELAEIWDEITSVEVVRRRALAVLARHELRAAAAVQLSAALAIAEEIGEPVGFVCLDSRLADAADREGLRPLPELE
jgi:predicted nucleic acid-binding protein